MYTYIYREREGSLETLGHLLRPPQYMKSSQTSISNSTSKHKDPANHGFWNPLFLAIQVAAKELN